MEDLINKVRIKLQSGIKISFVSQQTEVSKFWINKVIKGEKVPAYIIVALNEYFKKFGE